MVYSPHPPYEVLRTNQMDFATIMRMRRFSRFWDLMANSGNFRETAPMIWSQISTEDVPHGQSPFWEFMRFSEWSMRRVGRNHAIALPVVCKGLFRYLVDEHGLEAASVANSLWRDYQRGGRSDRPEFSQTLYSGTRPLGPQANAGEHVAAKTSETFARR